MGTGVAGTTWLTLRAPIFAVGIEANDGPKPVGRVELDVGMGGFGTDMPTGAAPPNSKTAGRVGIGACAAAPRFIFISAVPSGLDSVKLAFFSAGLNVVSSWSIIGAGSAAGFGVGTGMGFGAGIGAVPFVPTFNSVAGCFDQPMSERVVGFWIDGVASIGATFWRIFGADPPSLLSGE